MQLSLLKGDMIYSCFLPERPKGQYWVTQVNEQGYEEKVIGVEGVEGEWILKSNKNVMIHDSNNQKLKEIAVQPLQVYRLFFKKSNESVLLYAEPISEDRKIFSKWQLPRQGRILIGRNAECDIQFASMYASSRHAELIISDNTVSMVNLSKSNGTYVNGAKVEQQVLKPGDMIYIIGLKIIIGNGFIAINNPDGQVKVNQAVLRPVVKQQVEILDEEVEDDEEGQSALKIFYRSPRFKRDIEKAEIKIDPPPSLGNLDQTPLMLMLGPSVTMGMASLFTGIVAVQNILQTNGKLISAAPTLVMSISMLLGTVLWPILTRRHEVKKSKEREQARQDRYKKYLDDIRQAIANECQHQIEILHENHVTVEECADRIKLRKSSLWERTHTQNDFLKVRLGIGNVPLQADIKFPEKKFVLDDDPLQDELFRLAGEPKELTQVPITLSLTEDWISGLIGRRDHVTALAKSMILQLVALHSSDELNLVFIYDKKEQETWDFVKWLPHVWAKEKGIRFIATNPQEVKELSAYFEKVLARRAAISADEELKEVTPYYVVFALDRQLAVKAEMINTILKSKKNLGFSIVHLYDQLVRLPKECLMVVELERGHSKMYDKDDITGAYTAFQPNLYTKGEEEALAVSLANIQLDSAGSQFVLPQMLTFLDMFEVGKIEHLNALSRWKENNPTVSLETPVGVDADGDLFQLDLHEKFHGPHGLIAGMTGSGKSEFIITYILSLAVNYHPHEVAFILIDYKGGGMANAFTKLPHLAGTITNLDGAAVNRSLVSIQSELKRRQAIFSETSRMVDISNIDIYKYQKLYRDGQVKEPLPHLFIISDEFAELKTQQPEFMEQLVSAARIGRSLGVHLILATQKPSGVVDDQIWSNSRFRVCLKVQEKADSMDVIKRPDAAGLAVTGRFYVQVGYNELFELGQSAWGGAPYYPMDRLEKQKDNSVMVIDNLGRMVKQAKTDKRRMMYPNPPKQIDEINKYLAAIAKEEDIQARPLWLEPIPEFIYVDELKQKYGIQQAAKCVLNPVIGEVDDPVNQSQFALRLPLTQEGNVLIYGAAGSGKSTFVNTFIYSLMHEHTPAEVHLYLLDFGSETLRAFAKAPHVGDVVLSHEAEKMDNLFKMLYREMENRKKLFADYGGDYSSYIRATKKEIESIVVVIQNYSGFAETYEDKEEAIAYLTREGLKYGIYFILTALNTGAVRYRILQNFKQVFVLQLNDPSDYSGVLGNVDGVYPSKFKGRGIYKSDRVYEFQIAHIDPDVENTLDRVRQYCADHAEKWNSFSARKIPILPEKVDVHYLANEIRYSQDQLIPVGIEKSSLQVARFGFCQSYIHLVLSQNNDHAFFIQGLAEVFTGKGDSGVMVLDPEDQFKADGDMKYSYYDSASNLDQAIVYLFQTLVARNNAFKDAKEAGEQPPIFDPMICIIHSLKNLRSRLSEDSLDKLNVLLEKGEVEYNVFFILSDSIANISSISYETWFRTKVSLTEGIWVGNGINDQYQLKLTKTTKEMMEEIGPDFGFVISKGKGTLTKLVSSTQYREEVLLHG